jgi:hypothetical protein
MLMPSHQNMEQNHNIKIPKNLKNAVMFNDEDLERKVTMLLLMCRT